MSEFDRPATQPRNEKLTKKARLVEAGKEVLFEHFASATPDIERGFQFLSPSRISEIAGVSKGLIYHLWSASGDTEDSSFRAYLADVLKEVLVEVSDTDLLFGQLDNVENAGGRREATIRAIAAAEIHSILAGRRRTALIVNFALYPYLVDEQLNPTARQVDDQFYESVRPFYEEGLRLLGRRMKPAEGIGRAITVDDLARALSALTEGLASESLLYPEIIDNDVIAWDGGTSRIFEILVESIVMHLTEDLPGDAPSGD